MSERFRAGLERLRVKVRMRLKEGVRMRVGESENEIERVGVTA